MFRKKTLALLFLILVLLSACGAPAAPKGGFAWSDPKPVQPIKGLPQGTDGFAWWNDSVFYEIFVRSFYDSNADGIGDFNGVTQKLDYLQNLGITGIWLMPINPSPSYHGYDVTDYYAVNSEYGTLDDFKHLLDEAHKRGIRIIIDLVINHTSNDHPWFQDARSSPTSAKRNWYIWSNQQPTVNGPLGSTAWYSTGDGYYYYGVFVSGMPDLNYNEPAVREEMKKVASFWLKDVGIDGFRLDAARYLVEENLLTADPKMQDTAANHQWWQEFRAAYKADNPNSLTVGEVWTSNITVQSYLKGDELDLAFNFDLSAAIIKQINAGLGKQLNGAIASSYNRFSQGQSANFLTNHDQNRVMSQFVDDFGKARVAASILLTIPGVPFIYYGEEIGMTGTKPDERLRKPMQWSADKEAGFSTAYGWESPDMNYKQRNVAMMENDPQSLLSLYRGLVRLRNNHAALRVGDYVEVETDQSSLLAFLRSTKDECILVLINLSQDPLPSYQLSLGKSPLSSKLKAQLLAGEGAVKLPTLDAQGGFSAYQPLAEIPGYGTLIVQFAK
jgi:alpha-amylase